MPIDKLVARKLSLSEIQTHVDGLLEDFSHLDGLKRILLFGSAARGTMSEASDIDAVLIFDSLENASYYRKKIHSLRVKTKWPADLICVDEAQFNERSQIGGVLFVAREEGCVLFERGT